MLYNDVVCVINVAPLHTTVNLSGVDLDGRGDAVTKMKSSGFRIVSESEPRAAAGQHVQTWAGNGYLKLLHPS